MQKGHAERASRWKAVLTHLPLGRVDVLIVVLVTLAGLLVFWRVEIAGGGRGALSLLKTVELRSLDARFKMRGARSYDPRIVIVAIDENTLRKLGAFPVSRDAYARLIDKLHAGGARTIAFDIDFPTPEKNAALDALKRLQEQMASNPAALGKIRAIARTSDNDAILAESMKNAGNVILGHIFLDRERTEGTDPKAAREYYDIVSLQAFPQVRKVKKNGRDFDMNAAWVGEVEWGIEPNLRLLAEAAKTYGFFNATPDADGIYRREPLIVRYQDQDYFPSLAFQAAKEFEQVPDQDTVAFMSENGLERIQLGRHVFRTERDGTAIINYAGPYKTYAHYSMVDVISGGVPAEAYRDKIVLVGATALGVGDLRATPFESTAMGVEIHANTIDNLLHTGEPGRSFLRRGTVQEMLDLAFILVLGVGMGVVFSGGRPLLSTLSAILALLVLGVAVYESFARLGWWLWFVVPAGVLVVNYAGVTSFRMVFEEREKRKIRKTFSQYVSPGVIRLIERDPAKYFRRGGELKEMTIMFSDIRSFTTISEGMSPDELVFLLNEYLGEMTDILFKRWGTLDKYIGDAIMAFWGSPYPQPDHAERACACALDMQARLQELNRKWESEGRKQLTIGIGINTGVVNVGNMGSDRRLAWTVMGDPVNLASRLEGLNKEYHTGIIISESTWRQVNSRFVCRELDYTRVKGKLQPVSLYELLAFASEAPGYADLLAQFAAALAAYRRRDWDEAIERFEALLARYPDDGPSHELLKRSHEYRREAPAADWDGVYVMKTK
ncbi:MAG TPA: adenylate/guanylate cyclase domain-containing protein [Terriglobales bacterium]|nr:adenylate/guanylate cyclase domain-containing protein [Terriglobales bacterium]